MFDRVEAASTPEYKAWKEGQVVGDAVGYARGKAERDALVTELVEAAYDVYIMVFTGKVSPSWVTPLEALEQAIAKAKGES